MSFRKAFSYFWTVFAQWVKDHTTAEALMDGVKTAAWVVPLTILIWMYAAQGQKASNEQAVVLIKLRSTDPDRLVTVLNEHDLNPIVTMSGPRASIEQVRRELDQQGESGRLITVDVPSNLEIGGPRDVSIAAAIRSAPLFGRYHIDVSDVHPESIQVRIDSMVEKDLQIVAPADVKLDGLATFEPKTVRIRVPQLIFNDAKDKNAVAQIPSTGDLAKPGSHADVKLPVKLPADLGGDNITPISSLNVVANYQIKANAVDDTIDSGLPIFVLFAPSTIADQVQVEVVPVAKEVKIRGPKENCDQLKDRAKTNKPPPPYAILRITPQDVSAVVSGGQTSTTISKPLEYQFSDPEVLPTEPNKTWDVTIRKRGG